jgi:hypothetical protein
MIGRELRGINGRLRIEESGVRFVRRGFLAMSSGHNLAAEKLVPYESIVAVEYRPAGFATARMGFLQLAIRGGPELKNTLFTSRGDFLKDENTIVWNRSKWNADFESARAYIVRRVAPDAGSTKVCPDCAETVKAQANVCRFCGFRFDAS